MWLTADLDVHRAVKSKLYLVFSLYLELGLQKQKQTCFIFSDIVVK